MLLGGLQKHSLIDYPGKVSCVCFVLGCNFSCPYCHNPDLVRKNVARLSLVDEDGLYSFLQARRGFLDGVVVSGGEPTLNRELTSLCERIKAIGYPVKLDTNGSRPEVIQGLIEKSLVDYIAVDIKTDSMRYPLLIKSGYDPADLLATVRMVMQWGGEYEFRTTCVKPLVDESAIAEIAGMIQGASLYALQRFRRSELLHPEFFRNLEPAWKEEEMMSLKSIAEPWVKRCILR